MQHAFCWFIPMKRNKKKKNVIIAYPPAHRFKHNNSITLQINRHIYIHKYTHTCMHRKPKVPEGRLYVRYINVSTPLHCCHFIELLLEFMRVVKNIYALNALKFRKIANNLLHQCMKGRGKKKKSCTNLIHLWVIEMKFYGNMYVSK